MFLHVALCKDDPNGNVPLGKSCNRYWACQGGYPRLQRCPAMLVFDKDRKRCVSPPTADCDVPVTTPSPDDENQNTGQDRRRPNDNRDRGGETLNSRNYQTICEILFYLQFVTIADIFGYLGIILDCVKCNVTKC